MSRIFPVIWGEVDRALSVSFASKPSHQLLSRGVIDSDAEILKRSDSHFNIEMTLDAESFLLHLVQRVKQFELAVRYSLKKQKFRIPNIVHNSAPSSSKTHRS